MLFVLNLFHLHRNQSTMLIASQFTGFYITWATEQNVSWQRHRFQKVWTTFSQGATYCPFLVFVQHKQKHQTTSTAWKVSPNTEFFLVRIQYECVKMRTRKKSVLGHFSRSVRIRQLKEIIRQTNLLLHILIVGICQKCSILESKYIRIIIPNF